MNQKLEAMRVIESLPDDATLEDIQYHLYVMEKMRKGLGDIEAGRTFSHSEVKAKVREWTESLGRTKR